MCSEGSACWQCHFFFLFLFSIVARTICVLITPPWHANASAVRILACLLISGEVGERLIHLVGDRFVFTALIYQHVCNEKGGNVVLVDGITVSPDVHFNIFNRKEKERQTHISLGTCVLMDSKYSEIRPALLIAKRFGVKVKDRINPLGPN